MKVICRKIISPVTLLEVGTGPWAVVGQEYSVLAVSISSSGACWLRILDDDGTPILLISKMFESVSTTIPPNWSLLVRQDGNIDICPRSWQRAGFWEDFFERRPNAIRDFEEQLAISRQYA